MEKSRLLANLVDCLPDQIAVINAHGVIVYVNLAWVRFGNENALPQGFKWVGINYLSVCNSSDPHDSQSDGAKVFEGINEVISGNLTSFTYEYPCHSPTVQRWFLMRIVPLAGIPSPHFVISHVNITQRKLIEQSLEAQSITDPLTLIHNRRHFEHFFGQEWLRSMRDKTPISLVMFDLDHFKSYNDEFGHLCGDERLRDVARVIQSHTRRPTDLVARFGGEEFVMVLGNTGAESAKAVAESIRLDVVALPSKFPSHSIQSTISAGVATATPSVGDDQIFLMEMADQALYRAKSSGRNQVVSAPIVVNK